MRLTRADRSVVSEWWFTIDRWLLAALLLLIVGGSVLSLAASPSVAVRLGLEPYHFVKRHLLLALPAAVILIGVSMLSPRYMRRLSLLLFAGGVPLLVLTLLIGPEINGATRWLQIGMMSLQASEFVKPAFVLLTAWLLSERERRADVPSLPLAIAIFALFVALLVLQPDFGQALLVSVVWGGLLFLTGVSLLWVALLLAAGSMALLAAYLTMPHVAARIDRFINPAAGDTYQTDRAIESFIHGGWLGRGPGEGTIKQVLPDAHTDFIFAVAAEEYGLIACLALAGVFAFVVFRGLRHAFNEPDGFTRYAVAGLTLLFGSQALINMAVNVGLLPAKGMTLPFISYGGSSLLSMAIAMGFALGLTRRRPQAISAGKLKLPAPSASRRRAPPREIEV